MAVWSLSDAGLQAMGGQNLTNSLLTTVTTGNANTVGGWVLMHAATAFPVSKFRVHLGATGVASAGSNRQWMFDVGVGPASSETVIVQNVAFGGALGYANWEFPLSIPIGSRVAVRAQALTALSTTTMGMWLTGGGMGTECGHRATTYGAVPASSRGTTLTAPASANTVEGAWTLLTAATTGPTRWIVVGIAAPNTTTAAAANLLVDIGIGGSGAEREVVTDISCATSINEEISAPYPLTFPVTIPTGSRLVARYRGSATLSAAPPSVTVTGIG